MREENRVLQGQSNQLAALQSENERLRKSLASVPKPLSDAQQDEVLRLRGQVGILRQQLANAQKSRVANVAQSETATDDAQENAQNMIHMNWAKQSVASFNLYAQENNAFSDQLGPSMALFGS